MSAYSIYIASVHRNLPVEDLKNMFSSWGVIERVDFIEMNIPKANWVRAFIHFESIDYSNNKDDIDCLESGNIVRLLYVMKDYNNYWMNIYKNYAPVQKTTLNIHQLANNFEILKETTESTFSEQQEKIEELNQRITQQDEIIIRLQQELLYMRSSFKM
jgi:uncharacterized coiled-coil protein SlyX